MKKNAQRSLVLTVGIVVLMMLIPACEEQQTVEPDLEVKRARMIAAELQGQIKLLKRQHNRELSEQKTLLDRCLRDKKALEDVSNEDVRKLMDEFLESASEENMKLRQENDNLKARIKELEEELQKLKTAGASAAL